MTLGQTPLSNLDIVLYTDGSASLDPASAGWGVFISRPQDSSGSLWGPVITDCTDSDWIGAPRPTNNTGEISAIYHTPQWVRGGDGPSSTVARRRMNLFTDREYCVRLFGDNSIKPCCNKALIQRVWCLLTAVRRHHDLAISWVKAHTGLATPEAVGNATADRLAARGRRVSSGETVHPPPVSSRSLRRRSSRGPSSTSGAPSLTLSNPVPIPFAFHLTVPHRDILLRVARVCRYISPAPAVTIPAGFGNIVGE